MLARRMVVTSPLPVSPGSRILLAVVLVLPVLAFLPGCEDNYSEAREYPIRTDPIIDDKSKMEFYEPDRPGQLPLFALNQLLDVRNPYHDQPADKAAKLRDVTKLAEGDRAELKTVLDKVFGTPRHPKVAIPGVAAKYKDYESQLQLDEATLARGSELYRLHCLQCHGLTGDGRGPTSKWVNPHPRDYRLGLFKFQSVNQVDGKAETRPPRREDLFRTLQQGLEGTSMPAFNLLPDGDLDALVSYVIHLSLRGQAEYAVFKAIPYDAGSGFDVAKWTAGNAAGFLIDGYRASPTRKTKPFLHTLIERWYDSQGLVIRPGPYKVPANDNELKASVQNGMKLYVKNCGTCHNDYGRMANWKYDDWGTLVRPANLTTGVFRGGRRPIDLYWRIHSGVNGSGMANLGLGKDESGQVVGVLSSDEIWDTVNFLQALPYPAMRDRFGIKIN